MSRITPLVRPNIAALTPYSTARDEYDGPIGIFLDANESPYENGYNRYPDPHQAELKARIGGIKGIPVKNLFLGNGSDEAIDLVFRISGIQDLLRAGKGQRRHHGAQLRHVRRGGGHQ